METDLETFCKAFQKISLDYTVHCDDENITLLITDDGGASTVFLFNNAEKLQGFYVV